MALWGISLATLLQHLASICVKLIGQKKVGGSWNQAFFGSFRPPSKPFALGRLKHIPVPFYPPFLFLLVFPLSSRELIFIWCCVTLWWLRCTSLRPLFERDGAGFIWPDSWLCSQGRTCYDEVQWQSRETSLCPVLDPLSPPLNLRRAIVVVKAKIKSGAFTQYIMVLVKQKGWCTFSFHNDFLQLVISHWLWKIQSFL